MTDEQHQQLLDWLNGWAALDKHKDRTKPWRDGYRQAVRDVFGYVFDIRPDIEGDE